MEKLLRDLTNVFVIAYAVEGSVATTKLAHNTISIIINEAISSNLVTEIEEVVSRKSDTLIFKGAIIDALPVCLSDNNFSEKHLLEVIKAQQV